MFQKFKEHTHKQLDPTCTSHFSTAPFAEAGRMRVASGTSSPSMETIPLMSPFASNLLQRVVRADKVVKPLNLTWTP
jgi:hypothetical protein